VLHLVRHGRPLVVRGVPAAEWDLDPAAYDDVWALRASGRLPTRAAWFTSPEPKAIQTAQLLTDADVPAVRRVLAVHAGEDVVLVGHGTAWTLVVAALTGGPADVDRWRTLAMPDLITVDT